MKRYEIRICDQWQRVSDEIWNRWPTDRKRCVSVSSSEPRHARDSCTAREPGILARRRPGYWVCEACGVGVRVGVGKASLSRESRRRRLTS